MINPVGGTDGPAPPIRDHRSLVPLVEDAYEHVQKLGMRRRVVSWCVFGLTFGLLVVAIVLPHYLDWKSRGGNRTGQALPLMVLGTTLALMVALFVAWLTKFAAWRVLDRRVRQARTELADVKSELRAVISSAHIRPKATETPDSADVPDET